MSKKWYPVIDVVKCIECGACVNKCSHGVYEKNTNTPKVIFPEGCVDGCTGCKKLCPVDAISYIGDIGSKNLCSCNS